METGESYPCILIGSDVAVWTQEEYAGQTSFVHTLSVLSENTDEGRYEGLRDLFLADESGLYSVKTTHDSDLSKRGTDIKKRVIYWNDTFDKNGIHPVRAKVNLIGRCITSHYLDPERAIKEVSSTEVAAATRDAANAGVPLATHLILTFRREKSGDRERIREEHRERISEMLRGRTRSIPEDASFLIPSPGAFASRAASKRARSLVSLARRSNMSAPIEATPKRVRFRIP